MSPATARALRDAVEGPVHIPGDESYDAARRPWQRAVDPYPAAVAEAMSAEDVRAAIRFARDVDAPFAVLNTGHGAARMPDDGVTLRMGRMNQVDVDPERATARVEGGALWSDVIEAAAPHGLAPLSGTSAGVGVAGYTLGGGAGWLSRLHGFAADSLISAEIVTAGGDILTVSADEHPDLFWALRGGSGNFGVVTALEFRLYPLEAVYAGMAMYPLDNAAETFALYREWALDEPDESNTAVQVMTMPPLEQIPEPLRGKRVLMVRGLYAGPAAEAEALFRPLRETAGTPIMDVFREMSGFADVAAMLPPPPPMVSEMHVDLLREVPDAALDIVLDPEIPVGVELRHWGGAMGRPPAGGSPIGHRDVPFSVVLSAMAPEIDGAPAARASVRDVGEKLSPYATGGSFLNFLTDAGRTADAFTAADHRRLAEVKASYDPSNFFAANHNVAPA